MVAIEYLVSKGYKIEATGWRRSRYELDIVAIKGETLAFVEVKASKRVTLGPPELRVGKTKQKRIAEAASEYLSLLKELPNEIRFDVIGIIWKSGRKPEINHLESAFTLDQS